MSEYIKIGARVAYSRAFLKSVCIFTGWHPMARGAVRALNTLSAGCTIAAIAWDDAGPELGHVNVHNLVAVDRIHLEPQ